MPEKLSVLIILFQPMAVTISLVYAFGAFSRWIKADITRNIVMGLLFGFAAILSMELPMVLSEGVIVDLRNLFIGLAAGLFGWVAGLIALAVGITARLYIGGAGATAGVAAMLIAAIAAWGWRFWVKPKINSIPLGLLALGACISLHLLAVTLVPAEFRSTFLTSVGPSLVLANLAGSIALGAMIHRENIIMSETAQLRIHAQTDPLTRLMNRRHLKEVFDELPRDSTDRSGRAMLYFDLDSFKSINDTYGHVAGDDILKETSRRVAACLRPGDLFSRLGGDEFLIVLPAVTTETAALIAERCRKIVCDTPVIADGRKVDVTISIGVGWATTPPAFIRDLAKADEALYRAKNSGRDCVAIGAQAA